MNNVRTIRPLLTRLHLPAIAAAVMTLTLLAGCKKHTEGDGHDHGSKPPAKADEHAGHGHGSESGGAEGHADEVKLTAEAIERYGVKVQPAQLWALKPTFVAPARVGFNTEAMAHVGSPLRGRAVELKVRLGDTVKRGDALLVVESPELGEAQNDFFQKRIAAQSASPAVDLARVAWERAKALLEQSQGISLTEVQKREAEYKAAVASQRAAEAAVVGSENRLHLLGMSQASVEELAKTGEISPRYTVHAPIDGQVVQREVTLGELVSPDREALLVLADTSTLWVLADVPEARLHEIAVGAKSWVAVGTTGARRFEGQVAFVAPLVDAGPGRVLWASLGAPFVEELALRAGLHDALLAAGLGRGGALVPGAANALVALVFAGAHAGVAAGPVLAAYLLPAWWIGLAWERTNRLAPCVAIHATANAVALVACGRA